MTEMLRVLTFSDQFAPVWTDPETGVRGTWNSRRFMAAGFDVRELGPADWYAVDLDSRKKPLPPGSNGDG